MQEPERPSLFRQPWYRDWITWTWVAVLTSAWVLVYQGHYPNTLVAFAAFMGTAVVVFLVFGLLPACLRMHQSGRRSGAIEGPVVLSAEPHAPMGAHDSLDRPSPATPHGRGDMGAKQTLPAPGWYVDPEDARRLRYWSGEAWTNHLHVPGGP